MSVRVVGSRTRVSFTTRRPPGATFASNFAWDGGLSTTAASARSTTGEPIGSSPMITVQDAVPPRISGPYEGIQRTSRSSFMAARASTLPAKRIPWPPKPAMMIERSTVSAPREVRWAGPPRRPRAARRGAWRGPQRRAGRFLGLVPAGAFGRR